MSAACLLERYLDDAGEGALPAIPCEYPPPKELAYFDYDVVRRHIREQYYSEGLSDEKRKMAIMQDLKEGKGRGFRFRYSQSPKTAAIDNDNEVDNEGDDEDGERETDEEPGDDDAPTERARMKSNIDGADNREGGVISAAGEGSDDGNDNEESSLSEDDLEMLRIRAQRRKRGTLKRLHKPNPLAEQQAPAILTEKTDETDKDR
jgi:hypothetical protein